MSNVVQSSDKYIAQGVAEHAAFTKSFKEAKRHALNAGFYFLSAQSTTPDFEALLARHADKIGRTTVYRYINFAREVLEWAAAEQPNLAKDQTKLLLLGQDMVLQSPKGYISLCRELLLMRKFGEYDEVKYRAKKLGGNQIEFNFADLMAPLEVLARFGDANHTFTYPEGVDTAEYMTEVETKLEAALVRVRHIKQHGRVIET